MKQCRLTGFLVFALLVPHFAAGAAATASTPKPFYLHNGDRVVFYGDSITQQRFYTDFVETYVATRFPSLNVSFVNSGWGGERVIGNKGGPVELRLSRDVIPYKPTVITIMLGMNDGLYRPFNRDLFRTFKTGYQQIVNSLRDALPGLRFTLLEPSPYDDVTRPPRVGTPGPGWSAAPGHAGYNGVLLKLSGFVRQYATREGFTVADLNSPVVAMLEKANAINPAMAQMFLPDRVHPRPGGHLIMAEALLKAWNAPAIVSDVRINAEAKAIGRAQNARVYDLSVDGPNLSWLQVDFALPMPLDMKDPLVALAVKCSDVVNALDQEWLGVTGLQSAKYALKIDGDEIGVFTALQLRDEVNLAMLRTPMSEQAAEVQKLTHEHSDVHFARWRTVQVPLENSPGEADAAIKALDNLDDALVRGRHNAAQPRIHRFVLSPAE